MKFLITAFAATLLCSTAAQAAIGDKVAAQLSGDEISGAVTMEETSSGMIHVTVEATGVPQGAHGFHVHETGKCEAADGFKSAGGHLSGQMQHGTHEVGGPHPGDFPSVHVQDDGILHAEFFTFGFKLEGASEPSILDEDGSAVILHANADDYASQPSGAAGGRIACGVLEKQ